MQGTNIKIIGAQQAKVCNIYKSTRLKLLKTNAEVWFNKMCKIKHQKPNYAAIPLTTSPSTCTQINHINSFNQALRDSLKMVPM